jgi:hypothetical protein
MVSPKIQSAAELAAASPTERSALGDAKKSSAFRNPTYSPVALRSPLFIAS